MKLLGALLLLFPSTPFVSCARQGSNLRKKLANDDESTLHRHLPVGGDYSDPEADMFIFETDSSDDTDYGHFSRDFVSQVKNAMFFSRLAYFGQDGDPWIASDTVPDGVSLIDDIQDAWLLTTGGLEQALVVQLPGVCHVAIRGTSTDTKEGVGFGLTANAKEDIRSNGHTNLEWLGIANFNQCHVQKTYYDALERLDVRAKPLHWPIKEIGQSSNNDYEREFGCNGKMHMFAGQPLQI